MFTFLCKNNWFVVVLLRTSIYWNFDLGLIWFDFYPTSISVSVGRPVLLPLTIHPSVHDTGGYTSDIVNDSRSTYRQVQWIFATAIPRPLPLFSSLDPIVIFFKVRCSRQSLENPSIVPGTPADTTVISSNVTFRKIGFPAGWLDGDSPYAKWISNTFPGTFGNMYGVGPILPISILRMVIFSMGPG